MEVQKTDHHIGDKCWHKGWRNHSHLSGSDILKARWFIRLSKTMSFSRQHRPGPRQNYLVVSFLAVSAPTSSSRGILIPCPQPENIQHLNHALVVSGCLCCSHLSRLTRLHLILPKQYWHLTTSCPFLMPVLSSLCLSLIVVHWIWSLSNKVSAFKNEPSVIWP